MVQGGVDMHARLVDFVFVFKTQHCRINKIRMRNPCERLSTLLNVINHPLANGLYLPSGSMDLFYI